MFFELRRISVILFATLVATSAFAQNDSTYYDPPEEIYLAHGVYLSHKQFLSNNSFMIHEILEGNQSIQARDTTGGDTTIQAVDLYAVVVGDRLLLYEKLDWSVKHTQDVDDFFVAPEIAPITLLYKRRSPSWIRAGEDEQGLVFSIQVAKEEIFDIHDAANHRHEDDPAYFFELNSGIVRKFNKENIVEILENDPISNSRISRKKRLNMNDLIKLVNQYNYRHPLRRSDKGFLTYKK